ncbi:MAG: peroxiredoxin [Spiroplasma sp.]|nr:peroxiredoxin [Mycoplasmatales bacterium]
MERDFFIAEVKVGHKVDNFSAEALLPNGEFGTISLEDSLNAGKWVIVFFWPLDFTFVCPTEILAISDAYSELQKDDVVVFGVSTDSKFSHLAWTKTPQAEGGIGKINFPMLEDTNHTISEQFGVLDEKVGISLRGTFIISPKGILESSVINNLNVGRSIDELQRTLAAFQSGGLCPVNWNKGENTL